MTNSAFNANDNQKHDPALFQKFLTNQEKELALKAQELELNKQADKHNFEFAQLALKSKITDKDSERKHHSEMVAQRYRFCGTVFFVLMAFLIFALILGKDAIVMEILKDILLIGTGGTLGGVGVYSYFKSNKESDSA